MRTVLLGLAVLRGFLTRRPHPPRPTPSPRSDRTLERELGGPRWVPLVIAAVLGVATILFLGFIALLIVDPDPQLLAVCLGGGLAAIAAALVGASRGLLPREVSDEPHPPVWDPQAQVDTATDLADGLEGVTRRGVLLGAATAAGTALGGAAIALPLAGAGPGVGRMGASPWRAGRALVDEEGAPIAASSVGVGEFRTAFPSGADPSELASPVVVVRLDPRSLRLPAGRRGWSPSGYLAFSRICTHAGCAVSLLRSPSFGPHEPSPALVCPCHYSTFDVRTGGTVVFGPAGRPLPQLPLGVAPDGSLVAAGDLSGSVGPAWWGTDRGRRV